MTVLGNRTLEALAEIICGDDTEWYREGWRLPEFFRSAGLECIDHDGTTRKWWALERLKEYQNEKVGDERFVEELVNESLHENIEKIILKLSNPREYAPNPAVVNRIIESLNNILLIEGWQVQLKGIVPSLIKIEPQIAPLPAAANAFIAPPDLLKIVIDPELADILIARWGDAQKCLQQDAFLPGIIMMGSLLEGILASMVMQHPKDANQSKSTPLDKTTRKPKPFPQWTFNELINVAHDCGWIQKDIHSFSNVLREYRNMVHPWKQREMKIIPDGDTCKICWAVVNAAINDIIEFDEKQKGGKP